MEKEERIFKSDENHKLRATKNEDGKMIIEFYASVFNHKSRLIFDWDGVYNEIIREGAFDNVLASDDLDVIFTRDHDNGKILGRLNRETGANTLSLIVDKKGLKGRAELPETELGRETFELIERGDLSECSFVFSVRDEDQEWDLNGDESTRYINNVTGLYDTAIVYKGAYSNTDISTAKRHFEDAKKAIEPIKDNSAEHDIDAMTIRMNEIQIGSRLTIKDN